MLASRPGSTPGLDPRRAAALREPNRFSRRWILALLVADVLAFVAASYVAGGLVDRHWDPGTFSVRFWHSSIVFVALWVLVFERLGLYRRSFALSARDEFYFTVVALSLGIVPQLALFTLFPDLSTSRVALLLSLGVAVAVLGPVRAVLHSLRSRAENQRYQRVLIVGSAHELRDIEGIAELGNGVLVRAADVDPGDTARWLEIAAKRRCGTVVLARTIAPETVAALMPVVTRLRIHVYFARPELSARGFRLEAHQSGDRILLAAVPLAVVSPLARLAKRMFDIGVASFIGLLALPVMIVAALAIAVDDGFPLIFRQARAGRNGVPFNILKFRTMRSGAGAAWAVRGDDRITRVGRLLRRTSLDELPQLWNILRGEMSLVGPRPEMCSYAAEFGRRFARYNERHLVAPGVTGWAQIHLPRNLSPDDAPDVLDHDLFYVEHWSLFLDMSIIVKTAAEFLFHRAV